MSVVIHKATRLYLLAYLLSK